jgi:hypothetical protein
MNTQSENMPLSRSARAARKKKEEFESLQNEHRKACDTIQTLLMQVNAFEEFKKSQTTMSLTMTTVDKNGSKWAALSGGGKNYINEHMQHKDQKIFYVKNSMEYLHEDVKIKLTIKTGTNVDDALDSLYQMMQSLNKERYYTTSANIDPSYFIYNTNGNHWGSEYGPQMITFEEQQLN